MRQFEQLVIACALFMAMTPTQAQSNVQKVLSAPFSSSLIAHPTEPLLAWVTNDQGERTVYISPTAPFAPKALTDFKGDDGQDLGSLVFHPVAEQLFFVRGGAPNRQGETPNPESLAEEPERAIWVVNGGDRPMRIASGSSPALNADGSLLAYLRGGQIWVISTDSLAGQPRQLFNIRGSAGDLTWHPQDPQKIAFSSSRGDHSFVGLFDVGDERVSYLAPSVDRDSDPTWSDDGKRLAFIRRPNEKKRLPFEARREGLPWSILVHDLEMANTYEVWRARAGAGSVYRSISAVHQLHWLQDQVIFPYEGTGWTQLHAVDVFGGQVVPLAQGDFEIQYVSRSPDGDEMYFSSNQDDLNRQHIWKLGVKDSLPLRQSESEGIEWRPIKATDGTLWCLASDHGRTAQVAQLVNGEVQWMFDPVEEHSCAQIVPQAVTFDAEDGLTIHGQLFLPPEGEYHGSRPALMFFHGGSRRQMLLGRHHRQYYSNAFALNQYLASKGFVVLSVNYRSGIGYGMHFREALDYGARGASEYLDVLAGARYLQSLSDVDGEYIGLWGGSYGGYLTALGLARNSDLFAAGVDIHGVHDWNVVIRNFVPSYQAEARESFAEVAFRSSPMADIGGWRSPVLVIHGDDDRNVPFSETVDLVEALRNRGIEVEQLVFPDEVHGFLLHRNWVSAYEGTAEFFIRRLRP